MAALYFLLSKSELHSFRYLARVHERYLYYYTFQEVVPARDWLVWW